VDRLTRRTEQIEVVPESGRAVPEYERGDIRELIEQPYRVIYQIGEEQIDVLSVLHSRQQLPSLSEL
jgi:plasmid stabilization system protein ParE